MNPECIVLGRFRFEHRRIEPEPAVELVCINRIGSPFARLHRYRAAWPVGLRRRRGRALRACGG